VTETAAGNADTAFGEGLRTLPALIDLTNICQAAIMHDTIMCSPMALDSSSFLRSLDCVAKWSFPEAGDEQPPDDETAQGQRRHRPRKTVKSPVRCAATNCSSSWALCWTSGLKTNSSPTL
jgi:hypothetical protein